MTGVIFQDKRYDYEGGSLLDCLHNHGIPIPFSCKSGLCQACEMVVIDGDIPAKSQVGLSENKIQAKHILACQCYPEKDIKVAELDGETSKIEVEVTNKTKVSDSILLIQLKPNQTFNYLAGQYVRLYRNKDIFRCYSIASNPDTEELIELHIQIIPNGLVSSWLANEVNIGDKLNISEALGTCVYSEKNTQPTLFIASNSGLAPIFGMIKKALHLNHQQEFKLYHGVTKKTDMYLVEELKKLSQEHSNFSVNWFDFSHVQENKVKEFLSFSLSEMISPEQWKVYFCGSPEMVNLGKKMSFLKGISLKNLFSDSFVPAKAN